MADWGTNSAAGDSWGAGTGATDHYDNNMNASNNDVNWGADTAENGNDDGFTQPSTGNDFAQNEYVNLFGPRQ